MEKVVLFFFAACVLHIDAAYQYHFVYERKNWTEAQKYCREKYKDLAIVSNMDDVETLRQMADQRRMSYGSNSRQAWIGLYEYNDEWRWLFSNKTFYKDKEAEFRNWGLNQPNEYGFRDFCVRIQSDGRFNDWSCDSVYPPVCFDVTGNDATFSYYSTPMSWPEAQGFCRKHHTDLASVRNSAENEKIRSLMPSGGYGWLGLHRDSWKWVDGQKLSFNYWAKIEPNSAEEKCGDMAFGLSGQFEDRLCSWEIAFVCFSEPVKVVRMKLKLKIDSSLDLNDAVVQEEVLWQLKQKLINKGGDQFKLSWRKHSNGKVFYKNKDKL